MPVDHEAANAVLVGLQNAGHPREAAAAST
jgi:hypothetical protein